MKSKQTISLAVASMMAAGLLAGCGSTASSTASSAAESTAASSEAASSEAAAPADTTAAGKVYYLNFKPEQDEAWQALAKTYTEETGVPVTVVTAASGQYETTLMSEMAKSDAPTLFQVNGPVGLANWKDYCYDLTGSKILGDLTSDSYALKDGDATVAIGYVIESYGLITNKTLLMGILVSVLVGIALTLPISSAAICAALNLTGLAGGAAVAGCCAQMVGFAVMSFKENGVGGLVSQGIGTSMLQMPNILKKPRVWLPPIIASAITGSIATCVFKLQMNGPAVSSGMGTCGLVGQIGVYTGWVADVASGAKAGITAFDWAGLLLVSFVLPAVLCAVLGALFRKKGWIKDGDLKLD